MTSELFGSQYLSAIYSPWLLGVVLYVAVMILVLLGRKIFEGEAYNVSWSAVVGSATLFACMAIAGQVLHRPDLVLPTWLSSAGFHQAIALVSVVTGVFMGALAIYQTTWAKSQWVDLAFNFLMAPMFIYGIVTLVPVTFSRGTAIPIVATIFFLVVYVVAFILDILTGRLDQPGWREGHLGRNFPWS